MRTENTFRGVSESVPYVVSLQPALRKRKQRHHQGYFYFTGAMMTKSISNTKRDRIWGKSSGLCWYCGLPAEQIDHVYPRILGGKNNDDNLVPVCLWCNKSKRGIPLEVWRMKLALKSGLAFTDNQRHYWGDEIPQDKHYRFWFEREGLG